MGRVAQIDQTIDSAINPEESIVDEVKKLKKRDVAKLSTKEIRSILDRLGTEFLEVDGSLEEGKKTRSEIKSLTARIMAYLTPQQIEQLSDISELVKKNDVIVFKGVVTKDHLNFHERTIKDEISGRVIGVVFDRTFDGRSNCAYVPSDYLKSQILFKREPHPRQPKRMVTMKNGNYEYLGSDSKVTELKEIYNFYLGGDVDEALIAKIVGEGG